MSEQLMQARLFRNTFLRALCALGVLLAAFTVTAKFTSTTPVRGGGYAHWAVVNGHPLYYEVWGTGAPLVLLHGGGDNVAGSFSRQLGTFALSRKVIAPEQVGQGHTPDVPVALTYSAMMEDTVSLLKQLGVSNADVVGWSDGGIVALMLAARHPELVRRIVVSGVNISPDGLEDSQLAAMRQAAREASPVQANIGEKLDALWLSSPTPSELSPDILRRIQKPVLVMAGDHDVVKLEHTLKVYRALPRGQLYILPDTRHGTFVQRPQWVNPVVLSFLDQS
jgi:pimeloyl-ACP methyl ester carboxylesterase